LTRSAAGAASARAAAPHAEGGGRGGHVGGGEAGHPRGAAGDAREQSQAARLLGVDFKTLHVKVRRYDLRAAQDGERVRLIPYAGRIGIVAAAGRLHTRESGAGHGCPGLPRRCAIVPR
jgi:hypothetical protein